MQQSGVPLGMGEIRLRVGNEIEGLIHAKAHTVEAKQAGYSSVEELIADVAQNFNQIYMREPDNVNGKPTYSLVKTGNKKAGIMNGVAPVYFELKSDDGGNYYIVVTAMPKGDTQLARQTKRDRLIYSSPGLGAATVSGNGAVSHDGKAGAANRGGSPTSDKSDGLSTSTISSEAEESKEKSLNDNEREAVKGLSADAKNVYQMVRDKLAGMKNKKVARAASAGAVLLARHADIIARKVRATLGTPFTAMDYYRTWFDLQYGGEESGFTQAAMKKSDATSLSEFSRQMRTPVAGSGSRKKTFLRITSPSGAFVDVTQDDMIHMHNHHPEMTDEDFAVIQENMENFLRVHQDKTGKGDYGGETVLCKIKTPRGVAGVSYELLPMGRIFLKTAFFDNENGIDNWIAKNGTSKDLMYMDTEKRGNAASMLTGHPSRTAHTADSLTPSVAQPLSLSMIQKRIGVVNGEKFNQSAWHGTPHDFDGFDLGAIGTGEGAQVHGWGLYFAGDRSTSEKYKSVLSAQHGTTTYSGARISTFVGDVKRILEEVDAVYTISKNHKSTVREKTMRDALKTVIDKHEHIVESFRDHVTAYDTLISLLEPMRVQKISYSAAYKTIEKQVDNYTFFHFPHVPPYAVGTKTATYAIKEAKKARKNIIETLKAEEKLLHIAKSLDADKFEFDNGKLYHVEIPDDDVLLDEQKTFDEQPKFVQEKLDKLFAEVNPEEIIDFIDKEKIGVGGGIIGRLKMERKSIKEREWMLSELNDVMESLLPETVKNDILDGLAEYGLVSYDSKNMPIPERLEYLEEKRRWVENDLAERKVRYKEYLAKVFENDPLIHLLRGKSIYKAVAKIKGSDKVASLALKEVGIKGITYVGGRDGRCFVIFDDKAISIIDKFNQQMNAIIKGTTQDVRDGQRIVSLFEEADESTFLHEMGHLFLLDLERLADMSSTSAQELQTVKKWATWSEGQTEEYKGTPFAAEFAYIDARIRAAIKRGDEKKAEKLKRQWEHERFARGFERYLQYGEAPTKGLRAVFAKFRAFLQRVYQAFTGTGGRATAEVEAVMARMIAMEEESIAENIERGKKAMQTVVTTHQDVPHAMERSDLGVIDFVWGDAGKGAKFKQGKGVAHILAKHVPESGTELLDQIVETIARGEIIQERTAGGSTQPRLVLEHNGYVALLSLNSEDNAWLLSGWEKYDSIQKRASSASGEGDGSTVATATVPMRSRRDGEDALSSVLNISSEKGESNKKDSPSAEDFARSADKSDGARSTVGGNLSFTSTIAQEAAEGNEVTEIKTALVNLARAAWSDKKAQGKVSFKPSQKLRDKVQELFGHDIDEVFITADDMRHIKNDHSEHEEKRGQLNMTPENLSDVYDVVNSFDEAEIQKSDPSGNQKMLVVRNGDGKEFVLLIERGKHKAQVKTYYAIKKKQSAPMSDAHSPERNVQNDSANTVSSTSNIPLTEAEGKQEPTIEQGRFTKLERSNQY